MKKILKKLGLSLAALACVACAGVGVSLSSSVSEAQAAEIAERDYYVSGTGLRLVNDANGTGIRFHTNASLEVYNNIVESGTLIIPEVRFDGNLTLEDLQNPTYRPRQIVTKNEGKDFWYEYDVAG